MKLVFVYPSFDRHAQSHPELLKFVPCKEYIGSPSLGIASIAAATPDDISIEFVDDRITPFDPEMEADLFALSFFTPAATRALEIGDALRALGKTVVAGGIFPTMMPELCTEHFDAVVIGEGEAIWPQLIKDFKNKSLKPVYRSIEPVDIAVLKTPRMDLYFSAETELHRPDDYPVQISRGCPFSCHTCVVPLTMGKKIRLCSHDYVYQCLKILAEAGKRCCLTEDTSFFFLSGAKRRFKEFLEKAIAMKKEVPVRFSYIGTSIPMVLSLEEEMLALAKKAGINKFYMVCGFDPITQKAFSAGDKEATLQALKAIKLCQDHGIDPYTSFLAGNPEDDEGTFDRILTFANKSGIERAEFVIATPYPGTPFWSRLVAEKRITDRTWKHYNDANVVFNPYLMSQEDLLEGYLRMWREFYSSRQYLLNEEGEKRIIQF